MPPPLIPEVDVETGAGEWDDSFQGEEASSFEGQSLFARDHTPAWDQGPLTPGAEEKSSILNFSGMEDPGIESIFDETNFDELTMDFTQNIGNIIGDTNAESMDYLDAVRRFWETVGRSLVGEVGKKRHQLRSQGMLADRATETMMESFTPLIRQIGRDSHERRITFNYLLDLFGSDIQEGNIGIFQLKNVAERVLNYVKDKNISNIDGLSDLTSYYKLLIEDLPAHWTRTGRLG